MAKHKKNSSTNNTDIVIKRIIALFYIVLIVFGITTLAFPNLLHNLSHIGKEAEAKEMQDFGNIFLGKGEYEMAIVQYMEALRIYPEMSPAYINMGIAQKALFLYDEAEENLKKALEFDNVEKEVIYMNLAEISMVKNNPSEAVDYYLKAAEVAAFPMEAYQKAGELLNNTAQWDKAKEAFDKALSNVLNIANSYKGALARDQIIYTEENDKKNIRKLTNKGIDINTLAAYDSTSFNNALSRDGGLASIYNQYGYIYAMNNDVQSAATYFSKALQIKPDFKEAYDNLSIAYRMMGAQQSQQQ